MTKKLFTPGPGNVPQFIRVQLSKDIIHHRMSDYQNTFSKVTHKLKKVFKTNNEVIILTTSGTGAMEASITNLFSEGDEVLVINTGYFGERFIEMCQIFKLNVHHLDYEWGKTFNLNEVKDMFNKYPYIKGVFVTYHETSTGVVNHLEELGNYINETDALLIADCISGLVVHNFNFDEWHIDCALASSQKGFLLPPGLAFVALSDKATKRMSLSNIPKYYWDFSKYINYGIRGQNPFTPAISLVLALDIALSYILDRTIENIVIEKIELRKYLEEKIQELGFNLFIKDENIRGNVLVPVLGPEMVNLSILANHLDTRHNISVSMGQDKFSNSMLRIGLISNFKKEDIDELIKEIKDYIDKNI